jgi:hypothetical protein
VCDVVAVACVLSYEIYSDNNTGPKGGGGVRDAKGEVVVDSRMSLQQLKQHLIDVRV